jgi:HEAT repeat protein
MNGFWEIELSERGDEHESVERFCRLARAFTVTLGWDDVFHIQGRVQGSQMRDLEWTPADGARALHTLLADYREYFEGIYFPRVESGGEAVDDTRIYAHGVGLRLLSVRGSESVARRLEVLVEEVESGTETRPDASSPDPRLRRMALFALGWPETRGDRDNRALAAEIVAKLRLALGDEAPTVRATAAALAGRYRILAMVDDVRALLGDPASSARAAAIQALQAMDDEAAMPSVAPLLGDPDPDVRRAAFQALRHVAHLPWARRKDVVGGLAGAFVEAWALLDVEVRLQMLDWLVGCPQDDARRAVLALKGDSSERVRRKMVEVVATLERGDVIADLVDLLDDPAEEVKAAALEALSDERRRAALQADPALLSRVMERLERLALAADD